MEGPGAKGHFQLVTPLHPEGKGTQGCTSDECEVPFVWSLHVMCCVWVVCTQHSSNCIDSRLMTYSRKFCKLFLRWSDNVRGVFCSRHATQSPMREDWCWRCEVLVVAFSGRCVFQYSLGGDRFIITGNHSSPEEACQRAVLRLLGLFN